MLWSLLLARLLDYDGDSFNKSTTKLILNNFCGRCH